ncbi:hypothetical protein EJ110_NYTH27784 [Nymphaea thermarum]|nr:hypothetical protein EJ110_NYTH27784 [Nymphaea thermarum]
MAYNAIDELRYVVNNHYDVDDEFAEIPFERAAGGRPDCPRVEEEVEDDDYIDADLSKQTTDTSAVEARNGKDIQGIPWQRMNFTRDRYRETRLKQYKNFESLSQSRIHLRKEFKKVEKGSTFYDFQFNTRLVKSTVVHFQVKSWFLFQLYVYVCANCCCYFLQ